MKLVLLLFIVHSFAYPAFERRSAGARQTGLGGSAAALASEPWCMLTNPAAAAANGDFTRAVAFTAAPGIFGISELSAVAALALIRTPSGALGVSAERFGSAFYREITGTVTVAREFSGVAFGLGLSFQSVVISGYGSASVFTMAVGMSGNVARNVAVAVAARNINAPRLGASGENVPQEFRAALAYEPVGSLVLTADCTKQTGFDPSASFGCEYRIVEAFSLRCGVSQLPDLSCAGIGLHAGLWRFDYALTYHGDLGLSHVATLSLLWSH